MTTRPTSAAITSSSVTNAQQKTNLGDLTNFVGDLLGDDSTDKAAARAALEVPVQAVRIDIASVSGTVDLTTNAPETDDIQITGALSINAFTVEAGRVLRVTAGGAFTLVNGAAITTNTGANITFAAGETFMLRATAADTVEVLGYAKTVNAVLLTGNQTVAGIKTFTSPIVSKTAAKAWVKFNGVTGAISASHGVASITKGSAGFYTVNFSPALSSADYAFALSGGNGAGTGGLAIAGPNTTPTTTTFSMVSFATTTAAGVDLAHVSAIFYE